MAFRFVSEQITAPTDWCFEEPHHVIVVHRSGQLKSLEVVFDRGPSGQAVPQVGDVWVIPAGHRYAALAFGDTVQFCELAVPTAALAERDLAPRIRCRDPLVHQVIERMSTVIDRTDVASRLLTESLAEALRLHLSDQFATTNPRDQRRPRLDQAVCDGLLEYLEYNLDSEITLGNLAAHVDMTIAEFSVAFTETFHTTPYQFVLDRRIQRAKTLLTTSDLSITETSAAVGFSTPSHFTTTFKNRVGVTPSAYRRNAL
ncbi:helix-turn-helix transcriptional regulator [Mycolicibacterium frederiksbergense]|nr:helix-turn-helix transcriptional regulator [Mycolicibacterium frederiksbergense]